MYGNVCMRILYNLIGNDQINEEISFSCIYNEKIENDNLVLNILYRCFEKRLLYRQYERKLINQAT